MTRDEKGRFPKGVSGNMKGRPPKAVEESVTALLDSVVRPEDWEDLTGVLVKLGKKGNIPAILALFDRRYGKPTEKHEVTGKDGEPQKVLIEYVNSPYPTAGVSSGASGNTPKAE